MNFLRSNEKKVFFFSKNLILHMIAFNLQKKNLNIYSGSFTRPNITFNEFAFVMFSLFKFIPIDNPLNI